MRFLALLALLFSGAVLALPSPSCFPFGGATLPWDFLPPPGVSRSDWWCPQSDFYGFLGFSYPLEFDCASYSLERISGDFAAMKRDFGATMVRVYLPQCYTPQLWEWLLQAGVHNNMAVIVQVAWPLNGDELDNWELTAKSIIDILQTNPIAPYVFHSAEFGTEPIGDSDDSTDDGNDHTPFLEAMAAFRAAVKPYGIPVGISEDWDRPGIMSAANGTGLGPVGEQVLAESDVVHAHIMPYYHNNYNENQSWAYISSQIEWYKEYVPLPMLISETQWAWAFNILHQGGNVYGWTLCDCGPEQYTNFWQTYDDNCAYLKEKNVGWFLHAWQEEGTFNMLMPNGSYAIPNWRPTRC